MSTKHPCETVEASADVMKLAEIILSDCGCSTAISDSLQRRVAGRIQQHMDSAPGSQQQAAAPPSRALADIAAERRRQVEQEGWTPEHDDQYQHGEMARAAACYALQANSPLNYKRFHHPSWWPFSTQWWKPSTTRRDLVKAGALIAAEIERHDRAAQKGGGA